MYPNWSSSSLSDGCSESTSFSLAAVKLVQFCNRFTFPGSSRQFCRPFYIEDKLVGYIRPDVMPYVRRNPKIFEVHENSKTKDVIKVVLAPDLATLEERTDKVGALLAEWREEDELETLQGWRDEYFSVWWKASQKPVMRMERSATCLFGIKQYGVHVNGYLNTKADGLCMWIARRSKNKPTFPGKLDQMDTGKHPPRGSVSHSAYGLMGYRHPFPFAGGLTSGLSVMECAKKEAKEEASVPDELLKQLRPAGTVSYFYEDERGLFPEVEYVMDLEVPEEFTPVNSDGEADGFELMSLDKIKEKIIADEFKFNCALVILDFLIRHGIIQPDNEPSYSYLVEHIHTQLH